MSARLGREASPLASLVLIASASSVVVSLVGFALSSGVLDSDSTAGPGWPVVAVWGIALWSIAWTVVGTLILWRGAARAPAVAMLTAGALLSVGGLGGSGWLLPEVAVRLVLVGVVCVLPLGLLAYPGGAMPPLLGRVAAPVILLAGLAVTVDPSGEVASSAAFLVFCVLIAAVWWRLERGTETHRTQLLWVSLGAGLAFCIALPGFFVHAQPLSAIMIITAAMLLPAAVLVGALAPTIRTVRLLVVGAGVRVTALLVVFAGFCGVAAAAGWPVAPSVPAVGVVGLLAVAGAAVYPWIRDRLEDVFGRLMFGDRLDPVCAVSQFGEELTASSNLQVALNQLREALQLPYVAVERAERDASRTPPMVSGAGTEDGSYALPLRVGETDVGSLVVGLRPGEHGPDPSDRTVLRVVVPALAQTLHAQQLAAELQISRERVLTVVAEDRRRLRHDLHDGLGPTLTGVAYAADAAQNLVHRDPEAAVELIRSLRADTRDAIVDVRRLVDGLGPSALGELGLAKALRQQSLHLYSEDGRRLEVTMTIDTLPTLGAAIELAAYRIVTEALTNVASHASSPDAVVYVGLAAGALVIEVQDHGAGVHGEVARSRTGIGLGSMRERAESLGGSFSMEVTAGGACVRASLPVAAPT